MVKTLLATTALNYWDANAEQGKRALTYFEWADQTGLKVSKFFDNVHARVAKAGIDKINTINVKLGDRINEKETHQNCQCCGQAIKRGVRIHASANGRSITPAGEDIIVGDECYKNIATFFAAINTPDFQIIEDEEEKNKRRTQKIAAVTVPLTSLDTRVQTQLQEMGFNLKDTVLAAQADKLQLYAMQKDHDAISLILDKGINNDMINWATKKLARQEIHHPEIIDTLNVLTTVPDSAGKDKIAELLKWIWQYRTEKAATELVDVKDEIKYLIRISTINEVNSPEAYLVERYGKVTGDTEILPYDLYDDKDWKKVTIDELLGAKAVTKTQARSLIRTVGKLKERRTYHNKDTLNRYAIPAKWRELWDVLKPKIAEERAQFSQAKKKGKTATFLWDKKTYKPLKTFVELLEKTAQLQPDERTRETLIKSLDMPTARWLIPALYTEAQKIKLAQKTGIPVDKPYLPIIDTPFMTSALQKLVDCAIEQHNTPSFTKNRISNAGIQATTVHRVISELSDCTEFGIIPASLTKEDSPLTRVLQVSEDYKYDEETQERVKVIAALVASNVTRLNYHRLTNEGEWKIQPKQKFNIKQYEGKKAFSPEQIALIKKAIDELPENMRDLHGDKLNQAELQYLKIKTFLQNNKVYTTRPNAISLQPTQEYIPYMNMPNNLCTFENIAWTLTRKTEDYQPATKYERKIKKIQADDRFKPLEISTINRLYEDGALISPELAEFINNAYRTILSDEVPLELAKETITRGRQHYENKQNNTFTVMAVGTPAMLEIYQTSPLTRADKQTPLGNGIVCNKGQYYGEITREQLDEVTREATLTNGINILILKGRR